ncbi:hypothetical protein BCR39DRAFT_479450 [Naematelia encephala]|uniref:WD40-repeat-containing domain protein n=1 Tax=Naematelia encephala TaxID=71784 RepID=A0A1Y2BAY4_9TREE|nr:hypothetical protein BCR39DRAFT_479450 [Naematelia encephala]
MRGCLSSHLFHYLFEIFRDMGKHGKSKTNGKGPVTSTRPSPYTKKPRVDVRFEGSQAPSAVNVKAKPAVPSTKVVSDKGKGKAKQVEHSIPEAVIHTTPTAVSSTFVIVAGSYEKLLYGIEGSYKASSSRPNLKPIFIFPAHLACVKAVGASPGGKWLATGSEDEFVKVWDLRRRKEVGSLSQHTGSITSILFPTSSHLVTTSDDATISLFRTSDWALLKSLKGHSGRVNHVDVHPTGRVALSVGKDSTLKMWDLMRGRGAASLALGSEAELVKFSPNGTHFAVLFPKKIQIYSLTLKLLHTLETKSRFNSIVFAILPKNGDDDQEDVEVLCVGTEKGEVEVYQVDVGKVSEVEGDGQGDEEEKTEEEEGSGAHVERIGTFVGHSNRRVKSVSALPFLIPGDSPLQTVLLTTVSSDGLINLYDLLDIQTSINKGEENRVEPAASYDTKGSRLTCVFLADGQHASETNIATVTGLNGNGKDASAQSEVEDDEDEEDEDMEVGGDLYDSAVEKDDDEEDGVEVEFEDEEEEEEEEEAEGDDLMTPHEGSAAPLKPLLNPLQTDAPPPASTLVEPPRSPNPANPATDDRGINTEIEVPSGPGSAVGPADPPSLPPLPPDATVPPTPEPRDETPPVEPAGMIPPAVSTPTVITTEDEEPHVSSDAQGLESSASVSSLKRAGEDLDGREEKRIKESPGPFAAPVPQTQVDSSSSAPAPTPVGLAPTPASLLPPPWETYVEPPPRDAGPTTPLTITQHKHLLSTVRSIKKSKDAFNFNEPVDIVRFGIPHYANVVPHPMDLGTVEIKLVASDPRGPPKDKSKASKWDTSKGTYGSVAEIVGDVRQVWENTRKFNGPDHVVTQAASRLETIFEKQLRSLPNEPSPATTPAPPVPAAAAVAAGPSSARRQSISQPPVIRRTSEGPDGRPKREIHPPPPRDLNYNDGARRPKRRNDIQLQWALRQIRSLEQSTKYWESVSPFLYPVEEIIKAIPDYTRIIKRPIDLLKIKIKLEDGDYDDVEQFTVDFRLMLANAMKFNPPSDAVHAAAKQLSQLWDEKLSSMPPKPEVRDTSEDILGEDYVEDDSDVEDSGTLRELEAQLVDLQRRIEELKAKRARKKANRGKKTKAGRKQSVAKTSPGLNGNGQMKKPRKSKEIVFKGEEEDEDSEAEGQAMTLTQKQDLAEKIQVADGDTLSKAIRIIQSTTNLGNNNEEIELDIDALPPRTVYKLYKLVCGPKRKMGRKSNSAMGQSSKKPGRKGTGGVSRKSMNEQEEADRIRRMEAQLQSFDPSRGAMYEGGEDSDSSEDESSEEE